MSNSIAELYFDWSRSYRISATALVQFDSQTRRPMVSSAATMDLYDSKARISPNHIVDMSFSEQAAWNLYGQFMFRMTAKQHRILSECLEPITASDLLRRVQKFEEWKKEEFAEALAMLIFQRVIVPTSTRPRASAGFENRGILMLGVGELYINMAAALAESIRVGNPSIKIGLLHGKGEEGTVRTIERGRGLFDRTIEIEQEVFQVDGKFSPFLVKLALDTVSPFDETIFIDADSAIFPEADLEAEFDKFRSCDFAPACSGVFTLDMETVQLTFGTVSLFRDLFGLKRPIYRTHSYYMFFRKCAATSRYFETCRRVAEEAEKSEAFPRYRGSLPDEPIFSVASSLSDIRIFSGYYMPIVEWAVLGGAVNLEVLQGQFLGMTLIGNPPEGYVGAYNEILKQSARLQKNGSPWLWERKPEHIAMPWVALFRRRRRAPWKI